MIQDRSLIDLLDIIGKLNEKKVNFVSLTENIDTSSPSGKLLFSISGAFAEYERSLISERTKIGLENAKAKGKRLGRPKGVQYPKKKETVKILQEQGKSIREISQILNIGKSTVLRYTKN